MTEDPHKDMFHYIFQKCVPICRDVYSSSSQTNLTTKRKGLFLSLPREHHTFCKKKKNMHHPEYFRLYPVSRSESDSVEVKVVYGVEGNATFLECVPPSSQAELRWTLQQTVSQTHESRQVSSPEQQTVHHYQFSHENNSDCLKYCV